MDIVFNELSSNYQAKNSQQAESWLDIFFNHLVEISKRRNTTLSLISSRPFNELLITPAFSFGNWMHKKDKDLIRFCLTVLSKKPFRKLDDYYYYTRKEVYGLGLAHSESITAVSYPDIWSKRTKLKREFFDANGNETVESVYVNNISKNNDVDIFYPIRYFEHHMKHDNKRANLNDGESTLLYNIPKESSVVEDLLKKALGAKTTSRKLFSFDDKKGLYVEFPMHQINRYHAYHITDDNRVPNSVRLKLRI